MDKLNTETLSEIVAYIAQNDLLSLRNLSLVNHALHKIAALFLFRTINLRFEKYSDLVRGVGFIVEILEKYNCGNRVKRIEIHGPPFADEELLRATHYEKDYDQFEALQGVDMWMPRQIFRERSDELIDPDRASYDRDDERGVGDIQRGGEGSNDESGGNDEEEKREWYWPILGLLRLTPALSDFIYDINLGLPHSVLLLIEAIPSCRLHLEKFYFKGLTRHSLSADSLYLIRSPRLYSLVAYITRQFYSPTFHPTRHIIFDLLTKEGLAPNLKHVKIIEIHPYSEPVNPQYQTRFRLQQYFLTQAGPDGPTETETRGLPQLESLACGSLIDHFGWSFWLFTDLTRLTTLHLSGFSDSTQRNSLAQITGAPPRLEALHELKFEWDFGREEYAIGNHPTTICFLSLRPLQKINLNVRNQKFEWVMTILAHHGASLTDLELNFSLDAIQLNQVADLCPNLQHLSVAVVRTFGRSAEIETYRAISSLTGLESLSLRLDTLERTWDGAPPAEAGWDRGLQLENVLNGQEVECAKEMTNSAIDEDLARDLFIKIKSAQEGARRIHQGRQNERGLKVMKLGYGPPWPHRFPAAFIGKMIKTWKVFQKDDGSVVAERHGQTRWEGPQASRYNGLERQPMEWEKIYHTVFPKAKTLTNWKSYPLVWPPQ